ncbi:MAG TPA: glycosyltransferase family 9 protein [Thermoanaerobaculia bacterium]|nr:glycosyltransferase family 9 protein [Thermoanaerobaculia bacterium]
MREIVHARVYYGAENLSPARRPGIATFFDPRQPPVSAPASSFGPSARRPAAASPFADLPAFARTGPLHVLCLRPIHHVLEFEGLQGLLEALREEAPETEIHLHLRSAVRDLVPFCMLPVQRVARLTDQGGRGRLAAGLRRFLDEVPEGTSCVLVAPPRGARRLIAECSRVRVAAAVPLDFRTVCTAKPESRQGGASFLAALRAESPLWAVDPAAPSVPPRGGALRFLVHQARFHVGDTLWLTPLLREIKRRFRGAEVTVVGPPVAGQALEGNPRVDHLVPYHPRDGEEGRRRVLEALSGRPFDAALFAFARRWESRWLAEAAAGWGVPWRIDLEYHDLSLSEPLSGGRSGRPFTHEGRFFWGSMASPRMLLHALDPLLGPEPWDRFQGDRRVEIHISRESRWRATEALQERGLAGEAYAVLAPGGSSSRRWPAEKFARLAVLLTRHFGFHVLLEGAPEEADFLARIAAAAAPGEARRRIVPATDPLGVLAALLEGARLLVANDSAAIHVAEAVAAPTLYFAEREKLAHSHPRTRACWALWDDVGGDPAAITVEQALGAVREMSRRGLVRVGVR